MNTKRLMELHTLLGNIPDSNLNLCEWICSDEVENKTQQELLNCGTICCAVGWACSHPPFIHEGLRWSDKPVPSPTYLKHSSWDAVEAFFEINFAVAKWLFSEDLYPYKYSIKDVRKRIKDLLEDEYLYDRLTKSY